MVRLFASDIDGCLAEPYAAFDLALLGEIGSLAAKGTLTGGHVPAFTLCTGRPLGYAEAMAQAVGVRLPFLFEAGAGMFFPDTGGLRWHPALDEDHEGEIAAIRAWLAERARFASFSVEHGKRAQAGLIGAVPGDIQSEIAPVSAYILENHPGYVVAHTDISIDIMSAGITKRDGLAWLGETLSVCMEEMAFIGDTNGDLEGLRAVGTSFAPANATSEVKESVGTVTAGSTARGVLEAYRLCIESNAS